LSFRFEHSLESLQSVNVGLEAAEAVSVKFGVLILVVVIAPATFADFLALGRLFVVLTHLALNCGDGFQFLGRVVPSGSDRCTFIEIKLLGVIGPNQVFPGDELVCPEITFLSVHHPPMPFRRLGRGRFWCG
jgi:hypothetical protein